MSVERESPNQFVCGNHWNGDKGSCPAQFGGGIAQGIVGFVYALRFDVEDIYHLALRIHATGLRGYDLRRALVWRRFLNQVTGLVSLLLAAACAVLVLLTRHGVLPAP